MRYIVAVAAIVACCLPGSAGAATVLLGNQTLEAHVDQNVAGSAEAFRTSATAAGTIGSLSVYVDSTSTATTLVAGIYADQGGHPGTLLGQGSVASPAKGAWVTVPVAGGASVTAGSSYWIAVLSPSGAGTLKFRDRSNGAGASEASTSTSLSSLPGTWSSGARYTDGPLSAYATSVDGPVLDVSPASLSFTGLVDGPQPAAQSVTVANAGSGILDWTALPSAPWITVTPSSGVGSGTIVVSASSAGLAAATYTGSVTISAAGAQGSPAVVSVRLVVTAPDTTPPTVSITSPAGGATVSGSVTVAANASDDTGVVGVQFKLDGANLGGEDGSAPYSVTWDTTGAAAGTHTLTAVARDAAGHTTTSQDVAVTVDNSAPPTPTVLIGDQQVEASDDSDPAGVAEAFRTTATTTGTVTRLSVYVGPTSTATRLVAGIYTDSGGHPGALLGQGSISSPTNGAWNTLTIADAPVTAGGTYWIAVLGPVGSGTLHFRDRRNAGAAETSSAASLSGLPSSWSTGKAYRDGSLSAYGSGGTVSTPVLQVTPASLGFTARLGGADPGPQQLAVVNTGAGTLSFTAASDSGWLTVAPTGGTAPASLSVTVSASGLAVGTYTARVTVTAAGAQGSPRVVAVTLTVVDPSPSAADWLQIDHDSGRSGEASGETTLTTSLARKLGLLWSTTLDGKVTAQPLYAKGVQVAGGTHDVVVAASSGNSVYALDATSGAVLWRRNFGTQSGNCAIPGGYGVTGAPAIDKGTGRVYTVSNDGRLHALSLADGSDVLPAIQLIALPDTNKVWGGVNIVGSQLYIGTASDGCDTAPWRGQIYHVDTTGSTLSVVDTWAVVPGIAPPDGGGGIWGYGGVSSDVETGNVFAATGADSAEQQTIYANRMVELTPSLAVLGSYAPPEPSQFPCSGAPCDLDFGSTPVVFHPSGCPTMTAAGNKNGNLYVFQETGLAASGQPFQTVTLNPANDWLGSGGVGGVPAYWSGGRMLFVSDVGSGVTGVAGGLVGLRVGSDCTLSVAWSQKLGGATQPDSTPTVANGVVYVGEGNGGKVYAFDAATGEPLWNSGTVSGGAVYAAPMVADGRLFTGSWNGFSTSDAGTIRAFAPDTSSPLVSITSPQDGTTVSGSATVAASASDVQGVAGVRFMLDGAALGAEDLSAPYTAAWDTTGATNGTHVLTAVARDTAGNTATSAAVTVTVDNSGPPPPPPSTTVLLGDQQVEGNADSNTAGTAEAFRTSAATSGTLTKLTVYVDSTSTASSVVAGIYSDSGGHPGTLLGQGTLAGPAAGSWNDVSIPAARVTAGTTYWIAVLGPVGTLHIRDKSGAGASETASQRSLSTLPAAWTTGAVYADGPLSAYGSGTTP
jgi:outer membrane protein assembly factor BamB